MMIDTTRAYPDDVPALAALIARAFHPLPQCEWLVPDPIARREILPDYFAILVDQAMGGGAVYRSTDGNAVAVWMYMNPGLTRLLPDYDARLAAATGEYVDRFRQFDKILDEHHPADVAHHHLALLAVEPEHQNRGYGSVLLTRYDQFLDGPDQVPAYLEAATTQSVPLYQRHGYRLLPTAFTLPDGVAPMYPMWRDPRPIPAGRQGYVSGG